MCHHGSCEADPLKKSKSPVLLWIDVLFLGDETFLRMHFKQITQKNLSLASINRRSRKMNHWHHEKPWPSEQATCPLWDLDFSWNISMDLVVKQLLGRNCFETCWKIPPTWKIHQPGKFGAEKSTNLETFNTFQHLESTWGLATAARANVRAPSLRCLWPGFLGGKPQRLVHGLKLRMYKDKHLFWDKDLWRIVHTLTFNTRLFRNTVVLVVCHS